MPLSNVQVRLSGTPAVERTDSNGRYTISNVSPGTQQVIVTLQGYGSVIAPVVVVRAGSASSVDFEMFPLSVTPSRAGRAATIPSMRSAHVPLCPMLAYLKAHADGRVNTFNDAMSCVR